MQNPTVGDRAIKAAFRTGAHNRDRDTLSGPRPVTGPCPVRTIRHQLFLETMKGLKLLSIVPLGPMGQVLERLKAFGGFEGMIQLDVLLFRLEKEQYCEVFLDKKLEVCTSTIHVKHYGTSDSKDAKALWDLFCKYGLVVDMYLAARKTKAEWKWPFNKKEDESKEWKWTFKKHDNGRNEKSETCKRSFKYAMLGKFGKDKKDNKFNFYKNTLEIKPNRQQADRLRRCCKGKARNIHALRNIWTLLKQEGLGDAIIRYLGGLSFLCEWESEKLARRVLEIRKMNLEIDNMGPDCPISNYVGVLIHTFNMEEIVTSMLTKGQNANSLDGDPRERKDNDVVGESLSKMDLNFEKAAKNLNNYNYQRVNSSHTCMNDVGTNVNENELCPILVADPSLGPSPNLNEAQVPEVSKSATGFNSYEPVRPLVGNESSQSKQGFKKNGKSKIKRKPIIFSKSETSKDLQSRLATSLTVNSDDIKIEIGKQLGLVFENEQMISYNNCGLGSDSKISRINSLIRVKRSVVFGIQETKLASIDAHFVNSLWGNSNVDFLYGAAIGASGGNWQGINEKIGIINMYAP
ncbi:hypothetical protein Tco_0774851 [Tanacetum coccineum]|uniref:Uncharacterized protein n=1 Tax=Tanacetum coccineum TaxID=301880 RepID=A0ABQ4ZT79_9ASTR